MDSYFLCESGRIKFLENTFLASSFLERLASAQNVASVLSELGSSIYKIPAGAANCNEIIAFFEGMRENLAEDMEKTLPEDLLAYFKIKHDFHNLRVFAEEKFGKENKKLYSLYGSVNPYVLKDMIVSGSVAFAPWFLRETLSGFNRIDSEKVTDYLLFLQKNYYSLCADILNKQNNEFLTGYAKIVVDLGNLSMFFTQQEGSARFLCKCLVPGGNISKAKFADEDILRKDVKAEYPNLSVPVSRQNFEQEEAAVLISFLKNARSIPYGIEVLFSYFAARRYEINNVQRLVMAKYYNIQPDTVKAWLLPGVAK